MNADRGNVIPFGRRPAAGAQPMLRCPLAVSLGISEAIAMLWELREQLQGAHGLRKVERTRFDTLGRYIEDRLETALHSMEKLP